MFVNSLPMDGGPRDFAVTGRRGAFCLRRQQNFRGHVASDRVLREDVGFPQEKADGREGINRQGPLAGRGSEGRKQWAGFGERPVAISGLAPPKSGSAAYGLCDLRQSAWPL